MLYSIIPNDTLPSTGCALLKILKNLNKIHRNIQKEPTGHYMHILQKNRSCLVQSKMFENVLKCHQMEKKIGIAGRLGCTRIRIR